MKKVLLAVAGLMIAGVSFGQTKFGVVAGAQFSSFTSKDADGDKETSDLLVGLRAGVTADLQLADEFYIGTGLLYSGKGGKIKDADAKIKLGYLQVPINFLFKPEVGAGKLNLGAGPYVAYAVSGKLKGSVLGQDYSLDLFSDEARNDDQGLKRFDAGLGIVAGYELPVGLYLGIHADLGLVNTFNKPEGYTGDGSAKNTSFGVNVGFKF